MSTPSKRQHLRMQGWDFTSPGWYFLTLCARNMKPVFGTVVNGHLNPVGMLACILTETDPGKEVVCLCERPGDCRRQTPEVR